jgi:catechol 2,3-dioxygenase-like lactoylglutathione lyase family enzyme
MLASIHPKLPMRNLAATKEYYINRLGFSELGDYGNYLLIKKDAIELHFFLFEDLNPKDNYGQVYIRTNEIDRVYHHFVHAKVEIHPGGFLEQKSWGIKEFSLLDPDNNLLTFGLEI